MTEFFLSFFLIVVLLQVVCLLCLVDLDNCCVSYWHLHNRVLDFWVFFLGLPVLHTSLPELFLSSSELLPARCRRGASCFLSVLWTVGWKSDRWICWEVHFSAASFSCCSIIGCWGAPLVSRPGVLRSFLGLVTGLVESVSLRYCLPLDLLGPYLSTSAQLGVFRAY